MMDNAIEIENFIDLASNATAVEYDWAEENPEEPRLDDRGGCWQVFLRSDRHLQWIGETVNQADAVAYAEKVGRFLKIDVRKR